MNIKIEITKLLPTSFDNPDLKSIRTDKTGFNHIFFYLNISGKLLNSDWNAYHGTNPCARYKLILNLLLTLHPALPWSSCPIDIVNLDTYSLMQLIEKTVEKQSSHFNGSKVYRFCYESAYTLIQPFGTSPMMIHKITLSVH